MSIDQANLMLIVIAVTAVALVVLVTVLVQKIKGLAALRYRLSAEQELREQVSQQQVEQKAILDRQINEKDVLIARLQTALEQKNEVINEKQIALDRLQVIKDNYMQLQARLEEKEEQIGKQEGLLAETKASLLKEFELSASKLFEAKQQSFQQSNRQSIETIIAPFKQQLVDFHKQVEEVYHRENTQRNQLIGQIAELQKQANKISDDANNLAQALKGDNKIQGQWGEIVLERILEQSGLEKGREYITQSSLKNADGKTFRPDVIVRLPDNKDIVIDSKVALVDYERFAAESDEAQREQYQKAHVETVRAHIRNLSLKNYEQLEGVRTLDFVFMFIPIEAAYLAAIHYSPSLFKEAHEENIMLVSPSSLMVALRTVETMWRYEKQNANAEKIANSAGKIYDQFVRVLNALDDLGGYLNKASETHELVLNRLSTGRGNVLKKVQELKKLGAKTTKDMPKQVLDQMRVDDDKQIELLEEDQEDS